MIYAFGRSVVSKFENCCFKKVFFSFFSSCLLMKKTATTKRFLFLRQVFKIDILYYRNEILQKLLMNGHDFILCDETHDLFEIYDESAPFFLPI